MTQTSNLNVTKINAFRLRKLGGEMGVPLVPRLLGTRGKTYGEGQKNGTESRENLGQIECIEFQTGAI